MNHNEQRKGIILKSYVPAPVCILRGRVGSDARGFSSWETNGGTARWIFCLPSLNMRAASGEPSLHESYFSEYKRPPIFSLSPLVSHVRHNTSSTETCSIAYLRNFRSAQWVLYVLFLPLQPQIDLRRQANSKGPNLCHHQSRNLETNKNPGS